MPRSFKFRSVGLMILAIAGTAVVQAQDTRTVTEPTLPDPVSLCSIVWAETASTKGDLAPADNTHFDTARIQGALTSCGASGGGTVELQAQPGFDAFQLQPISIPANVILLIDAGVTVFASLNPRDYDASSGSCGIIAASSPGCTPLITVRNAPNAGIMGGGTINGRGGDLLVGQPVSWWDLARQAQAESLNQYNPRLIQVTNSNNFVLYQITITNAPNFHVALSGGDGFTAWGVTINTPYGSRNTDGIDPGGVTNATITESSISDGDDNIAVGPPAHRRGTSPFRTTISAQATACRSAASRRPVSIRWS